MVSSMKDLETDIFANGCEIMFETITSDNKRIRVVRAANGKEYKMIYNRNEHYVFVISSIERI